MPASVPLLATHTDPVVAPWTIMALGARGDADKHPSLVFDLIPVTFLEGAVVTLTLCLCFVGFVVALGRKLNNDDGGPVRGGQRPCAAAGLPFPPASPLQSQQRDRGWCGSVSARSPRGGVAIWSSAGGNRAIGSQAMRTGEVAASSHRVRASLPVPGGPPAPPSFARIRSASWEPAGAIPALRCQGLTYCSVE